MEPWEYLKMLAAKATACTRNKRSACHVLRETRLVSERSNGQQSMPKSMTRCWPWTVTLTPQTHPSRCVRPMAVRALAGSSAKDAWKGRKKTKKVRSEGDVRQLVGSLAMCIKTGWTSESQTHYCCDCGHALTDRSRSRGQTSERRSAWPAKRYWSWPLAPSRPSRAPSRKS